MKREALDHPKTKNFSDAIAELLPASAPVAMALARGLLEMLWSGFTAKFAPDGLVGRYSNRRVAQDIDWPGDPDGLIRALIDCGFLDETPAGLVVHDWPLHCDRHVHRRLIRDGRFFADGTPPGCRRPRRTSGNAGINSSKSEPRLGIPMGIPTGGLVGMLPGTPTRIPAVVPPIPPTGRPSGSYLYLYLYLYLLEYLRRREVRRRLTPTSPLLMRAVELRSAQRSRLRLSTLSTPPAS